MLLQVISQSFAASSHKIDSLRNVLEQPLEDEEHISALIALGTEYGFNHADSLRDLSVALLRLCEKNGDKCGIATAYHFLGIYYYDDRSNLGKAKEQFERSLKIREEYCGDIKVASSCLMLGNVHSYNGDYDIGNEYFYRALSIYEKLGLEHDMSMVYLNLGQIAANRGEYEEAREHYRKGVRLEDDPNSLNMGNLYNGIGGLYQVTEVYDTALFYFEKGMKIFQKVNHKSGLAHGYNNIGITHYYKENEDSCMDYFKKSLLMRKEIGDKASISQSYNNIGILLMYMENYPLALRYSDSALIIAKKHGLKSEISDAYESLYDINYAYGEYYDAVTNLKKHMDYKDSLSSAESERVIKELDAKYESLKKEQELQKKNVRLSEQNNSIERQNIIIWMSVSGGILLAILLFLVYNRQKVTKRQKRIIEDQKLIVEEKQSEIISSIRYAKRIQEALLKSEDKESAHLPDHFVLYIPKDIVSGDFYWVHEKENFLYLAVGDCTGHGVPGGFLTMLGTAFLNEILSEDECPKPADVLDTLRYKIVRELSQKGERGGSRDGMDISMVRLNLKTNEIVWAGANNPFWLIRKSEVELDGITPEKTEVGHAFYSIRGDKEPIGYFWEMTPFTNHELKLEKGDIFYLFSDGYADQFGGPKGRKYKYKYLKKTFLHISEMEMEEQKKFLHDNFIKWMGDYEQIDDVCVMGVRI